MKSRRGTTCLALTFPGTRANIRMATARHRRHSTLLVRRGRARLLIDGGADWLDRIARLRPTAMLVTHAHPDHAGGLARGAPCPVHATADAWRELRRWPLAFRGVLPSCRPVMIDGFCVEAWPVEHALALLPSASRCGCLVRASSTSLMSRGSRSVRALGAIRGIDARLAHDGLTLDLRERTVAAPPGIGRAHVMAEFD